MSERKPIGAEQSPARIDRDELRAVIRHAAELYATEADRAEDRWTEAEVLRVADELGLPARHVRRALYELPARTGDRSIADRLFGWPIATSTRVIPSRSGLTLERLEDYLTTSEYFQPRRRRSHRIALAPADDMISRVARRFRRPRRRFHLAHAGGIVVAARPVDDYCTHVRVDVNYRRRRGRLFAGGMGVGALAGGLLGAGAAVLVDGLAPGVLGTVLDVAAYGGGIATGVAGGVGVAVARFRRLVGATRLEVDGMLDRLERGTRLDPPRAPWIRRIRRRIGIG